MSAKGRDKSLKDPKVQRSGKGRSADSPGAILPTISGAQRDREPRLSPVKKPAAMQSPDGEQELPLSATLLAAVPDTITKPILEAIDGFKTMLMVRVEHMASECTLIRHDLDKIRGLTEAEGRIGEVEDQQGSQAAQIADLHAVVRSLVHKVDDAENRQRRNNIRVVGLPEGAEGSRPAAFAESLFKTC